MSATPEIPVFALPRLHRNAAWAALALMLAACAGAPAQPPPATLQPAAADRPAVPPAQPAVVEEPAPAADREARPAATESVQQKVAARPAKVARAEPERLRGLSGGEVSALIGAPQFLRVDDPAAMWQYQSGSCVLDLFLYADGPVYRVRHYTFRADPRARRAGAAAAVDPGLCLARLIAARKGLKS